MTIPFYVFPQIIQPNSNDFRGDTLSDRLDASLEYRSNCLEAPQKIPTGACAQSRSGEFACSDWHFRDFQ